MNEQLSGWIHDQKLYSTVMQFGYAQQYNMLPQSDQILSERDIP